MIGNYCGYCESWLRYPLCPCTKINDASVCHKLKGIQNEKANSFEHESEADDNGRTRSGTSQAQSSHEG